MTNTSVSVRLTPKIRLARAIKKADVENPANVSKLSISGRITNVDLEYIRKNMSKTLQELDMSNANFGRNEIPFQAFSYCKGLTSVVFPDSIVKIGELAFARCIGLTSIKIPDLVTDIDPQVFIDCEGLTSVEISKSAVKIGAYAFSGCTGLTSVIIPDSVTNIKYCAFCYCKGLTINIPASTIEIGSDAIPCSANVHPDNPAYASENGILFNKSKTKLINYPPQLNNNHYVVPDSVIEIETNAFQHATCLTSVKIPDSTVKIGCYAFANCSGLKSVDIPRSVKKISEGMFACCGISSFTIPEWIVEIEEGAFCNCKNLKSITIPDTVEKIGKGAFYKCSALTSVNIPKLLTTIEWGTFCGCSALISINIPKTIQKIEDDAFCGCICLTSITFDGNESYAIPDSITEIGSNAFYGAALTSPLFVHKSLTKIGSNAFPCPLEVHPDNPAFASENGVFFSKDMTKLLIYPANRRDDNYIIPDSVVTIGNAFKNCALKSVFIPASMIEYKRGIYGESAFDSGKALTSITVHPDNPVLASVDGVLFNKDKTNLIFCPEGKHGVYTIPDTTVEISDSAFRNCSGLTSIVIPNSVKQIGIGAFFRCSGLISINIPDSVTNIKDAAFQQCSTLSSIFIPASVTNIENSAFLNCPAVITIHPDNPVYKVENGEIEEK